MTNLLQGGDFIKNSKLALLRGTMSQVELWQKSGVSRDIISRLENGKTEGMQPRTIAKLAKAFDMPVEEFKKWVT